MNKTNSTVGVWTLGFALFSMFFGSGNLIFPIEVGTVVEQHCVIGILGFIVTAVLLPLLGSLVMIAHKGDYLHFFYSILTRPIGIIFLTIILISWIPLGSGPRCVTVAYGAIKELFSQKNIIPLWLFSLLYCSSVLLVARKKNRIIDFLGTYLTPLLLTCLFMIFTMCFLYGPELKTPCTTIPESFKYAILQGYYTQDLISSFFFSSIIIGLLSINNQDNSQSKHQKKEIIKITYGAIIGVICLGIVYSGLLFLGATYSDILKTVQPEQRLPLIGFMLIGTNAGFVTITAIILACFSTSIALVLVFSNFLKKTIFQNKISDTMAILATSIMIWSVSMLGFSGISSIIAPIMEIVYPMILLVIITSFCKSLWKKRTSKNFIEN